MAKKADLAIIDFKKPHLYPLHNEASHLVYATKSADVDTVIIDGQIVMENRKLTTIKIEKVMEMVEKAKTSLLDRVTHNIK